ncbi:unnamed protein product [Durusdinium trenchii]|uniref:Uncharacterized protein n=1 Tax=Durusdinium trenchii TaxID=1381693 RepID=A0ABP0KF21_9DINO
MSKTGVLPLSGAAKRRNQSWGSWRSVTQLAVDQHPESLTSWNFHPTQPDSPDSASTAQQLSGVRQLSAGTVFQETLHGLPSRDQEARRQHARVAPAWRPRGARGLLFAGTSNLVAVRWLMVLGANAKARDKNGTTMLHAACRSGSFLMVQELLKRDLPVDAADAAGWTPLHVAAMMGRRELSLLLLQAQGNPHAHNKRGASPLEICSDLSTREAAWMCNLLRVWGTIPKPRRAWRWFRDREVVVKKGPLKSQVGARPGTGVSCRGKPSMD